MDKSIFKPLLKIHDELGEYQTLLSANGFTVDPSQAELLLCLTKWKRMSDNGEKIPSLDIKNINKFRIEHVQFLQNEMAQRQIEQQKAAALAAQKGHKAPMELKE